MESLSELKQSKLVEIKEIERHENILKRSQVMNNSKISRSASKMEKSRFTEDEVKTIKEIMKKQKEFDRKLKEK